MRIFCLVALVLGLLAPAQAADTREPLALVKDVAGQTFDRIREQESQWRQNPELLRGLVNELLLPYVDVKFAAYKVIGPSLQSTSKEQREQFVAVFRDHLIATYAALFTKYRGQTAHFPERQPATEDDLAVVKVEVTEAGKPDIHLEFRLRQNAKTKEWRAYDMVAEGVSMLSGKEAELGGLIRQKGIDAVIEQLQQQNSQRINLEDKSA